MSKDRESFQNFLMLAIDPAAIENEAIAALLKIRELVRRDTSLAHLPSDAAIAPTETFSAKISAVHPDWAAAVAEQLSRAAYDLDLKCKIAFDVDAPLTVIHITCHGSKTSHIAFEKIVDWCAGYVHEEQKRLAP